MPAASGRRRSSTPGAPGCWHRRCTRRTPPLSTSTAASTPRATSTCQHPRSCSACAGRPTRSWAILSRRATTTRRPSRPLVVRGDRRQEWQLLISLGRLWTWRDYARTGAYFREALEIARAMGDPSTVAHSLNRIGNWHLSLDEPLEALRHQREALSTFEELDHRPGVAETLGLLAMTSYLGGDLLQGTGYCRRAVAASRALDDRQALTENIATLALG